MATVLTVPQTTIPKGAGVFTSGVLAAAGAEVRMNFTQVSWPLAGDVAMTYTVDLSQDGGATWAMLCFGDVSDVANPGNAFIFGCPLPGAGNANRKVRVSYDFKKALTVSGSLQVN